MDYKKNNNNKIILTLAKKNIRGNRRRNVATMITIAFAVCVVVSMALMSFATNQTYYDSVKDSYQGVIQNATDKEISQLINDNRFEHVGAMNWFESITLPEGDIYFLYYNDVMMNYSTDFDGSLPLKQHEIIVSKSYLSMQKQDADVGDMIQLGIGKDKDTAFKIVGIMDDGKILSNTSYLIFSKDYLEHYTEGMSEKYTVNLWLKNANEYGEIEAKQIITQICVENGISVERINFNHQYFIYAGGSVDIIALLAIVLISGVMLFAAAIVIYTIFYISVGGKTREYGQLRTLGATRKQIKNIVIFEGITLGIPSILLGILLGWIIGYILQPDGWNWGNTLLVSLITGLLSILVVWLSIRSPAKLASDASPIEAQRFSSYLGSTRKVRSSYRKTTPIRIAFLNMVRSPKKAILTMLSLGLCGALLICAASLQKNITAENVVRAATFQYGDYKLAVIGDEKNSDSEVQQLNNPLNEQLRNKILAIKGVDGIREWRAINGKASVESAGILNMNMVISGYAVQDEQKLTRALAEGTADYQKLSQNNGVVVNSSDTVKEVYGWTPQLGDKIEFVFLAGNGEYVTETLTIMGFTKNTNGLSGLYRMPDEVLQRITGTNCIDSWEIITTSAEEDVIESQIVQTLQNNPYIQLQTYTDALIREQSTYSTYWSLLYIIVILIGVFGIINLINTNTTNILARSQEIGILQAVGMTSKQLRTILTLEGIINTLVATLITISVGTPIGYVACTLLDQSKSIIYSFPWQVALLYFIVLLAAQLLLALTNIRTISKIPVIERVNTVA